MNTKEFDEVVNMRKSKTFDVSQVNQDLVHGIVGITTEAGEIADIIKKAVYKNGAVDAAKVVDECGDMLFYVSVALRAVGSSLEEAMIRNDKKLEIRYGKAFSVDKFNNKDKAKEEAILNSN